jgi:glycosyltransferase involved in cell wall biosynthesis
MKVIIYHTNIIKIGGVETFTYNLCKQLSKYYDVLLLYKTCDWQQLERLEKIVQLEEYDPSVKYNCDVCILSCSWGGYPEAIIAKDYWQMIHANYKELLKEGYKYVGWDRTTRHIAVSNTVAAVFEEVYKIKCDVIYNILDDIKETKPILKLVSATRLSSEKGYDRMVKLANILKSKGIKFRWTIFTNREAYDIKLIDMPEIIYMTPSYDIFDYIKEADYGVQLSNTEGYSYFVNECLQYGTAMLCTNFDSVYESVVDGYSGYILDMKLSNLDLDKLVNQIPKGFKYKPKTKVKDWTDRIGNPVYKIRKVVNKPRIKNIQDNKQEQKSLEYVNSKGNLLGY